MQIREYSLPAGWYPRDAGSVSAFLSGFKKEAEKNGIYGCAAVSPHAGWYYSGRTAAIGVSSLNPAPDTIVIIGGHLSASSPALFAMEDAVRTPFGSMRINAKLRETLLTELDGAEDRYRDNTVETLLPMAHYFFPDAELLWLRLPSGAGSYEAGKTIRRIASELGIKVNALASTDLTHYGGNYGFAPKGSGKDALRWVREVNDAAFIKAVESGDADEVLRRANEDSSSCSAGAVLGAMGFAQGYKARLLDYATSADAGTDGNTPDSFVGYAAFAFDVNN
ncbi:MAG: AmmeMemoRadiSam system protein B [Treponema sp.]|nr:AmmeMemoRadiSam system protein B [Treponema sp.]